MQDSELGKARDVPSAGQSDDLISGSVAPNQIERAFANGAGSPQNGNPPWGRNAPFAFSGKRCRELKHGSPSPDEQAAAGIGRIAERDQASQDRRNKKTINPKIGRASCRERVES